MKKAATTIIFYFVSVYLYGQATLPIPAAIPDTTANSTLGNSNQTLSTPLQTPLPVSSQNAIPYIPPTLSAPVPTPTTNTDTSMTPGRNAFNINYMPELIYSISDFHFYTTSVQYIQLITLPFNRLKNEGFIIKNVIFGA